MKYSAELLRNKRIGKVVYIVEGARKELTLLDYIFTKILDYSVIIAKRDEQPFMKYESKNDNNSKIILISAKNSNIKHIASESGHDYLDRVYRSLFENFGIDLTNSAIFYIFDRDQKSNDKEQCEQLISILKNSRDNGVDGNGILLLSYPCIESYIKSCIDDTINEKIASPKEIKKLVSAAEYQYDKLDSGEIERACINMLLTIEDMTNLIWDDKVVDDFADVNQTIFMNQEELYKSKMYRILSLLSISFIDLGLIKVIPIKE